MRNEVGETTLAARAVGNRFERLLVVGLGSIGRRHVRVARRLFPQVRIVALRHRDSDEALPDGVDQVVRHVDDAIAFAPQGAVIASPASMHLAVAEPLVRAGVPLLIEKPISASSAGVRALLAACAARSIPVLTGYNLRFLPSLAFFRDRVRDGAAGAVLSVRSEVGQYLPDWRPGSDYRLAVSARAELGGGVLLELSHEFDYLRWIFGDAAWVSAVTARRSDLEIDVEDTAFVTIGFAGWHGDAHVLATVALDFVRRDATRACTVIGSETSLRWNGVTNIVERFDPATGAWVVEFASPIERDATYEAEWLQFAACVLQGASPCVSGADGLATLAIVDAARLSAASGHTVVLADPRAERT